MPNPVLSGVDRGDCETGHSEVVDLRAATCPDDAGASRSESALYG
jgi:hypothetical protein